MVALLIHVISTQITPIFVVLLYKGLIYFVPPLYNESFFNANQKINVCVDPNVSNKLDCAQVSTNLFGKGE